MVVQVILALLKIVTAIMKSRSDKEQQEIGRNDEIRKQLAELAVRSNIARQIEIDSQHWDASHVDDILRKYYRD